LHQRAVAAGEHRRDDDVGVAPERRQPGQLGGDVGRRVVSEAPGIDADDVVFRASGVADQIDLV
jgi:hypothetical protein